MEQIKAASFPSGLNNNIATVSNDFFISNTEVTYETWYIVKEWANKNGYYIKDGRQGNDGGDGINPNERKKEPVTYITWRDAIVFCNAITEYFNTFIITSEYKKLDFVYTIDGEYQVPIKVVDLNDYICSTKGCIDNPYININANGFRLPSVHEWELAARYRGNNKVDGAIEYPSNSGIYYNPGNFASGANSNYLDETETKDAAVILNDLNSFTAKTLDVKSKRQNHAGLYDMGGNVWEWVLDWNNKQDKRVLKGGAYSYIAESAQVGFEAHYLPYLSNHEIGFRLAMNYFE